jgi:hypothetical protein
LKQPDLFESTTIQQHLLKSVTRNLRIRKQSGSALYSYVAKFYFSKQVNQNENQSVSPSENFETKKFFFFASSRFSPYICGRF